MTKTLTCSLRWIFPAALAALIGTSGCNEEKDDFEIVALQGRVEKITLTGDDVGEISVHYYSEKHKEEIVGTGKVTKETEILINGVVAKLKDIREGERIRGDVRIEKKGGQQTRVVLKIVVDRPKPVGGTGG